MAWWIFNSCAVPPYHVRTLRQTYTPEFSVPHRIALIIRPIILALSWRRRKGGSSCKHKWKTTMRDLSVFWKSSLDIIVIWWCHIPFVCSICSSGGLIRGLWLLCAPIKAVEGPWQPRHCTEQSPPLPVVGAFIRLYFNMQWNETSLALLWEIKCWPCRCEQLKRNTRFASPALQRHS